jgi:hypothetical protein
MVSEAREARTSPGSWVISGLHANGYREEFDGLAADVVQAVGLVCTITITATGLGLTGFSQTHLVS